MENVTKLLNVLIVEDSEDDYLLMLREIRRSGYNVTALRVETSEAMADALQNEKWDVILSDYKLPHFNALDALNLSLSKFPDIPFIIVSGTIGEDIAVGAVKAGAADYILKDNLKRLGPAIDRELRAAAERRRRKQAEEELRKSEERYRALFEQSMDAVYITTRDGKFLDANKATLDLFGYTREDILEIDVAETYADPGDRPKFQKAIEKHGFVKDYETRFCTKEGRLIDCLLTATVRRSDDGSILGYQGIMHDITKSKRMQDEIRQSEAKYRTLIQRLDEGVYQSDLQGNFVTLNEAGAKILGFDSPEQVIGKCKVEDFYCDQDDRSRIMEGIKKEGFFTDQHRIRTRKGVVKWVLANNSTWTDASGNIIGYEGVFADITAFKQAEERQMHATQGLIKAMNSTIESIAMTVEMRDPYTAGHQRRVTDLVCAICSEMGLPQDQIEGLRMAAVVHDIGKIYVPAEILSRPGKLTDIEFGIIKIHPQAGYDILKGIDFPWPIAQAVVQHHERLNGSGYPAALSGDDIILEAKILAVADVVEAIASHRPYRPSLGIDKALEEISQNKGVLYDLDVSDACIKLFTEKGFKFD